MGITPKKLTLIIVAICCAIMLYPREVILVPEAELTVYYDNGQIAKNIEVSRSWNNYMGDGWKANIAFTDENGIVKFKAANKRFPIIAQSFLYYFSPFLHFYPGYAGSFKARDPQNHKIWERLDFRDDNCCPNKIVMKHQETQLETTFIFGDLVSE
ncbi:MAG TPA: hypothetical protein PKE69_05860 [Pyrinomonadaceae bacterium]|nr:hypothetical protein [Pyrinomonadaceae bacterium]